MIQKTFLIPHPLTKFEIQKYYQNRPRFYGVYSRDFDYSRDLPETTKNGTYVVNLDEHTEIGTH